LCFLKFIYCEMKDSDMYDYHPEDSSIEDALRDVAGGKEPKFSKEDQKRATKELSEMPDKIEKIALENAKQLDNLMVWLAGGALFIISSFIVSDIEICLLGNFFLGFSLWFFGSCIASVITSYRSEAASISCLSKAERKNKRMQVLLGRLSQKHKNEWKENWQAIMRLDSKLRKLVISGERYSFLTGISNVISYWCFIIGLLALLVFASLEINNSGCIIKTMIIDEDNKQDSASTYEEKAAQVAVPHLEQLVDSTDALIGESPVETE